MDSQFVDIPEEVNVEQRCKCYIGKGSLWIFCLSCLINEFHVVEVVMYHQICGSSGF